MASKQEIVDYFTEERLAKLESMAPIKYGSNGEVTMSDPRLFVKNQINNLLYNDKEAARTAVYHLKAMKVLIEYGPRFN